MVHRSHTVGVFSPAHIVETVLQADDRSDDMNLAASAANPAAP